MRRASAATFLFLSGCFVITAQDIARHDRALEPPAPEPEPSSPPPPPPPEDTGHDSPQDALEISDSLGQGRRCLAAELEAPGDIDWFRFTGGAAGELIAASTVAASAVPASPTDTVLTSELGPHSNDSPYGRAGTDSVLMLPLGTAVQVSEREGAGGAEYGYEVCGQLIPLQDLEPNDLPSQASPLELGAEPVHLVGGDADGTPDVYAFSVRPERVYRVSLLAGHALDNARLVRVLQSGDSAQSTSQADYDEDPWALGYPPDAALMFREPTGSVWLALDAGNSLGPYALNLEELPADAFPPELEPNDEAAQAQPLALILQGDGSYRAELQGTLEVGNPQDIVLLEPTGPGPGWNGQLLDVVVQSASVGSNQDLQLSLLDPGTGQQVALADTDPGGLLDPDPVLLDFALDGYGRLVLGLQLLEDRDELADAWFLTVRVHPPDLE